MSLIILTLCNLSVGDLSQIQFYSIKPGHLALSLRPSDPVTLRNVSGLSGPGPCQPPGLPKAQEPGDPEKCQWPQWPRTLPGHRDFPKGPLTW